MRIKSFTGICEGTVGEDHPLCSENTDMFFGIRDQKVDDDDKHVNGWELDGS